jgi:hypothetical protein
MRGRFQLTLMVILAFSSGACDRKANANSHASVTVELSPPRPYRPQPGFSLATDLPDKNDELAEAQRTSRD